MSRDRTRTWERQSTHVGETIDANVDGEDGDDSVIRGSSGVSEQRPESGGLRDRATRRAGQLFSPRIFLVSVLVIAGGLFAASTLVPIPGAGFVGVFAGAFLLGLAVSDRRYVETVLAGALVAGASTLLDFALVAVLGGLGVSIAAVAGGIGAAVAAAGTYFGRDMRDGLTRDL